uniref:Sugar 3-C-methyl transferase n=1 Tax=Actinomadura kijaniata TaxID=46161 RepID=UPI00084A2E08|nr:Chain A, Sugar 3-C-methyl transferase [Actinomadura kijaniata]5T6B_B Chain B, Sugar 3-C-methyl transferase [Actinomadura kijaniata]5T6B_C Chain C, Sugar 3-C-methyl transferase [Actinomadura kijaniata]5T6B_D Chain D, Sugar 3-C-methyl transferase [Actinomadura kijaniata]
QHMTGPTDATAPARCRVCGDTVDEFLDLGRQPLSDRFLTPADTDGEFFYRLAVGRCHACGMVQLTEEVPRHLMFHEEYPYHSSGSSVMREHFAMVARDFLATELTGPDPFVVEIGCNDGIMLRAVHEAGVRHLGFEPSAGVAEVARSRGVRVRTEFFEKATATAVRESEGPADVIYAANTMCHIPYLESVFQGADALLGPDGVVVFEDPYLGDIVAKTSFDQIYDEHFYLFSAGSVAAMAERFGFELVDVERLPVHGGEVRYTLARRGARTPTEAVGRLLAEEREQGLDDLATLRTFAANVHTVRDELVALLTRLRAEGHRVVGYGATAKSATVTNFCGIGPDLVSFVCDTTPGKQHRLTPGKHLPVRPAEAFADPYPDYALLFAWNHAEEIMAKEQEFHQAGGRWILYVPEVHIR